MMHDNNPSLTTSKFEKIYGKGHSLPEAVKIFIRMSYCDSLYEFKVLFGQEFFEEFLRQATPVEIYMIYINYHEVMDVEWKALLHFIATHPLYAGDIVLLKHFYQESDLDDFCDAYGYFMALDMANAFVSQKDRLMIEHLNDYISTMSDLQYENNEMPLFIG